ncbi:hypothetical protein BDZ45DRAFT_724297 [Acephala macrosclerotiorum]|nr:hypothetical protein BDZ45DRAFT_724297 [Acephala macrosclerotiorum]
MSPTKKLKHLARAFSGDLDNFIEFLSEAVVNSPHYDPREIDEFDDDQWPIPAAEKMHSNLISRRNPSRTGPYNIDALIEKTVTHSDSVIKDWTMIKLVRDLSNVNTQFRQELGEVFWAHINITLSYGGFGNWNSWEPLAFFSDSPAICKGIKSLALSLKLWITNPHGVVHFKLLCKYLTAPLELIHLRLRVEGNDYYLAKMGRGGGPYKGIEVLRLMNVTKSFEVTGPASYSPHRREYHEARIRQYLMPITLRTRQLPPHSDD